MRLDLFTGELVWTVQADFAALLTWAETVDRAANSATTNTAREPVCLGIDMPIGLSRRGDRLCDIAARKFLGQPRSASVFPVAVRGVLEETVYQQANALHRQIDGRGMTAQSFHLLAKIREIDRALAADPARASWIFEVHPEVSFAALAGASKGLSEAKKTTAGHALRRQLLRAAFSSGQNESIDHALATRPRSAVGTDDVVDALAVLWSAMRFAHNQHNTLPEAPPCDARGLPMRIVY